MYKLNIQKGINKRYTAIIKQLFFGRLWLTIEKREVDTKKEAKQLYKAIAY